jgi:putative PEP-CTERM system TPR-repeat lipoprotein
MLNGLAHYGLGQMEKAKQYLEIFQRSQSNSPVSKLLAQIYFREDNSARAIDVLEAYLRAQPGDAQAVNMLASAHMMKGRYAKAAALIQEALEGGDSPALRTTLGISLVQSGHGSDGIAELEAVYKKDPAQGQAGTALLGLYLRSAQTAKAIATGEALVKQFPSNAGLFNLLGLARGQSGNGPAAKAAFGQALKLDPSFTSAKLNLARLEASTKAYDAAAARLADILKTDEKNTEAMYEMASLAERRGQPAEVQRWLEKASALSGPKEVLWGLALVAFHLRNGRAAAALEVAKQMSAKAPDNVAVLLAYGRAQLAIGDKIGARSTFSSATRFADYDATMQVDIAGLQMAVNNLDGATYSLEKALSGQPDYLPAVVMMAGLEIRKNEFPKAEARAREVLAKYPKRALGYTLLGNVANGRGQSSVALENYKKAHQLEPSTGTLLRLFQVMASQDGGKLRCNSPSSGSRAIRRILPCARRLLTVTREPAISAQREPLTKVLSNSSRTTRSY